MGIICNIILGNLSMIRYRLNISFNVRRTDEKMFRSSLRFLSTSAETAPKRELSRHVTSDGRTSLKKHLFDGRNVFTMWSKTAVKPETIPIFAAIVFGMGLAFWFGTRHLATSPDVQIDKLARKSTIRNNHEEGRNWVQHHASMKALPGNVVPEKEIVKKE